MLVIGVTGGIGCGKSEVCRILERLGAKVIDADAIAREITDKDAKVIAQIRKTFGEEVFSPEGKLNRRKLAQIVFSNKTALEKLNRIVHPRVFKITEKELAGARKSGIYKLAVINAALIYEVGMEKNLDLVVVVSASLNRRIERLTQRNGMTEAEILARINVQMPLQEKVKRADYVIENDGTLAQLETKVKELYEELTKEGKAIRE